MSLPVPSDPVRKRRSPRPASAFTDAEAARIVVEASLSGKAPTKADAGRMDQPWSDVLDDARDGVPGGLEAALLRLRERDPRVAARIEGPIRDALATGGPPATLPFPTRDGGPLFKPTDYGNAQRLVAAYGSDIRYCHTSAEWWIWDQGRWRPDKIGRIQALAKDAVRRIGAEAPRAANESDRKEILRWALVSESRKATAAMIELARSEPGIPVLREDFDTHPYLMNVRNGTIDLRTGKLRAHDRKDLLTCMAPIDYDEAAECPRYDRFLREIFVREAGGDWSPDDDLIGYVDRAFGHALSGDNTVQELLILHGEGANGKSVLLDLQRRILGPDYACQAESNLLMARRHEAHPTGLADLAGKRFVTASETGDGKKLAEALVKNLTGDGTIKARLMRQDFFEFDRTFKIVLATNHRPEILGSDHGIWRRIRLVPFHVRFVAPEDEAGGPLTRSRDEGLAEALWSERAGILARFVRGFLTWQQSGMRPPAVVREATDEYRREMDVVGGFLADRCIVGDGFVVPAGQLYEAYTAWCERCRITRSRILDQRSFGQEVERRGHPAKRASSGNVRQGLALRAEGGSDGAF